MNENARAREPEEQAAMTGRLRELSYGHRREDWPNPLREPYEPAQGEFDLLYSQVPGHRWNSWRRLTQRGPAMRTTMPPVAAIAEEVALLNQVRETGHEKAVDWIYGERLLQPTEAQPSSGKAHDK